MKKNIFALVFLVCLQFTYAQKENSLSGKIIDKETKKAIPFAIINIPDIHISTQSNIDGKFILSKIPAASYELQISSIGYRSKSVFVIVKGEKNITIVLDDSNLELNEVVVTGTSKATQIRKTPIAIVAINKEYLVTNLSTNVIDAIVKIPGVNTVSTGPNVSKPYIRGLGYNRILTLFDGVRQEGQQWGDEHGIEIDKYLIDKVEVIKGPASLLYGSDALAGVVNLIPNQAPQDNKISGNYTSEFQSNNGMFGESLFLAGNKNGIQWGGRVSKRNATNYQNSVDGRVYNTAFDDIAANAFVGIHKNWGYSDLNVSIYDDKQEIPDGSRDSISRKFTKQIYEDDHFRPIVTDGELNSYKMSVLHQRVQHYRAFWKNMLFLGNSRLSLNLGFQKSERREYSHPEAPYQLTPGLDLQLNTFNYDIKYYLPEFDNWETTLGVNGMFQTNNVTQGTEFVIPSYKQFDFGGFAMMKRDFGKLNVSGGLRYDYRHFANEELYVLPNSISGFDQAVSSDTVGATKLFSNYKTHFEGFSGSFGLAYLLNDNWSLKANVARGYRAPNISEISANGVHPGTGFYQIGNSNFSPEFSLQEDIGFDYTSKYVTSSVSLFVNNVTNYIYNSKLLNPDGTELLTQSGGAMFPTFKFQQGDVLLYGTEANLDFHITKNLHFENSFSLIYGDNNSFKGAEKNDTNKYVPLMPPARYNGELRYNFTNTTKLVDSFVKFELNCTAAQNRVFSYENTETPTAGYTLINVGAGTGFRNNKGKTIFNLYLLGNNIFNVAYQNSLSRLKYFEQYSASPNGKLGIFDMGRNISFKIVVPI